LIGFVIGAFTGYSSGKTAYHQSLQNNNNNDNNQNNNQDEKSCSENNQDDYICQAFKDGKVFETGPN
jgi:hypothetical protein